MSKKGNALQATTFSRSRISEPRENTRDRGTQEAERKKNVEEKGEIYSRSPGLSLEAADFSAIAFDSFG